MHVSLVKVVMKGMLTEMPYPWGKKGLPSALLYIVWMRRDARRAVTVAGSGRLTSVVSLTQVYSAETGLPVEKAMAGIPRSIATMAGPRLSLNVYGSGPSVHPKLGP